MPNIFETPILFIIYNKVEETKQVFMKIQQQKPRFLYIAADGPRVNIVGEREKCELIRKWVIDNIDWECDVRTLFRKTNIGCGRGISEAITWFFENVEEGIILEDDCLPNNSFFKFCSELLCKYRNESRIAIITGNNFQAEQPMEIEADYYFSIFPSTWGSAFWKRTWENYDLKMSDWGKLNKKRFLNSLFKEKEFKLWWMHIFDKIYSTQPTDTFAYQFHYLCMKRNQLSITPKCNLVSNIGHGNNATHTKDTNSYFANLPRFDLDFPLKHPTHIARNYNADVFVQRILFGEVEIISFYKKIKRFVKRFILSCVHP